jgi:uncharacterized protein YjbJ (UPF0337 family)
MGDTIGKITETVGRVTGDRETEAKGRVEQADDDVSDEAVADQTQVVRSEHRDIDAPPASRQDD